jgi:NhaP-type Na+/H+ or K+/H+ antiporter
VNPIVGLVVLAIVTVGYGLLAKSLDRIWISAPIVFVVTGILIGPAVFNLDAPTVQTEWVRGITELTLAVLLFVDASTVRLRDAAKGINLPARLLGIGLPLTGLLGALVGLLVLPGLGWTTCALLACILAPTDAALGLAVVTNHAVPAKIRRTLNIESGLNDGLATPFVTFFLAVIVAEDHHGNWVTTSLREIVVAIALGAATGLVLGLASRIARAHSWMDGASPQLVVLITPLLCYGAAVAVGANGFVAAYVCGFAFGIGSRRQLLDATTFTEDIGLYASFAVWAIFGMLFAGPLLRAELGWRPVLYAVASLTLVRMVPVAVSLAGTRLHTSTTLFVGWFGPRGLASVVFTLIAVESLEHTPGVSLLLAVATWTILLSVVLHGLSATPLAQRYGAAVARMGADASELDDAGTHVRVRRRSLSRD